MAASAYNRRIMAIILAGVARTACKWLAWRQSRRNRRGGHLRRMQYQRGGESVAKAAAVNGIMAANRRSEESVIEMTAKYYGESLGIVAAAIVAASAAVIGAISRGLNGQWRQSAGGGNRIENSEKRRKSWKKGERRNRNHRCEGRRKRKISAGAGWRRRRSVKRLRRRLK